MCMTPLFPHGLIEVAVSHEEAIGIIKRDSGKHFDPYLVGLFLTYADAVRIISQSTDEPNNPGRFNL